MKAHLTVAVTGCVTTALFALLAAPGRRRITRSIARTRIGRDRPTPTRTHRFGIRALTASIDERRDARRRRPTPGAVAALLDQIARLCASGTSLSEAFESAADSSPLMATFDPAVAAIRSGDAVARGLDRVPTDDPDVALAVHVLRLCAAQGGAVGESLDRAASTLRERETVANERRVQSAQARLSAQVLTVLPVAFGGWTIITTPAVQRFVLTPAGLACVVVGLGLNAGGWVLMRRVTGVRQ